MAISVFVVDGRPVRLARLKTCLGNHSKIDLVGCGSSLTEALRQIGAKVPEAVLVGGELIEMPIFPKFAEALRELQIVLIPVWVFPFSKAEVDALFSSESPAAADEKVPDGDTSFLIGSIVSAVTMAQLESGRPGSRKLLGAPAVIRPILIGASTGGVEALHAILECFPPDCPPVLVVQHMRGLFKPGFVGGLDRACKPEVVEAWDGAPLQRGRVYVAPGEEAHLAMSGGNAPVCRLIRSEPCSGHRPSIDVLFDSGARAHQVPVAALLSGMGRDGADGMVAIRQRGGHTIAQDRASCVVYGMPRAAMEAGGAVQVLPLSQIGPALLRAATRTRNPKTARAD